VIALLINQAIAASTLSDSSQTIALSLRVLQERLQNGQVTPEVLSLGGMTNIDGLVLDDANKDAVLFGTSGKGPTLHLDDFVVALQNCMSHNLPPGCSIDPHFASIEHIQKIWKEIYEVASPTQVDTILKEQLEEVERELQNVRVFGVPRNTRFTKIIVDADYHAKRVVNGTASPGIEGFRSLVDIALQKVRKDIDQGKQPSIPTLMSRFWFTPGTVRLSRDESETTVLLDQCEVKLLTEKTFFTKQGQLVGAGYEETFAQQFAEEFTKRYDEIAEAIPIYAELKSLFRLVAIAKALDYARAFDSILRDFSHFIRDYRLNTVQVPDSLSGIIHVTKAVTSVDQGELYLWFMCYGGVSIDIRVSKENCKIPRSTEERERLKSIRGKILKSRPSLDELNWIVPREKKVEIPINTQRLLG
jgi:hypothetical protein